MTLPDRLVDAAIAQGHQDPMLTVHVGDCREVLRSLPERSVHTVVTSPPYWGLRDYGHAGQLGLEQTPEEYVANMVDVFREVRRVLRDDGTLWLNLGDSYAAKKRGSDLGWATSRLTNPGTVQKAQAASLRGTGERHRGKGAGVKEKDLIGIPWRVAFALQADGWYLRSDIIWAKTNPMPESVTDRPTKAHEYLFLLSRSPRYFFDAHAVREDGTGRDPGNKADSKREAAYGAGDHRLRTSAGLSKSKGSDHRNIRDVWTIATQAYPGAHFATFPPKLVEPCIKAGTSERGACADCGAPWVRMVERESNWKERAAAGATAGNVGVSVTYQNNVHGKGMTRDLGGLKATTIGWRPSCDHDAEPVPATVLDPFGGSGTTAMVARSLGRRSIIVELNPEYAQQCIQRATATWDNRPERQDKPSDIPEGSWLEAIS